MNESGPWQKNNRQSNGKEGKKSFYFLKANTCRRERCAEEKRKNCAAAEATMT